MPFPGQTIYPAFSMAPGDHLSETEFWNMANALAHPRNRSITTLTPGVSTAANDDTFLVGVVDEDAVVTAVTYTPEATITGATTNNRALSVINKGQDGAGTTVVATLTFANGVNATAFDEKTITLTATAADLNVTSGDVLALFSDSNGTGIVDPGGLVKVSLARR